MTDNKPYVFHNSQELFYRDPFGAVPAGREVRLRLGIQSDQPAEEAALRIWTQDKGETVYPMMPIKEDSKTGDRFYEAAITPDKHQLVWYYFVLRYKGVTYYYSRPDNRYGGIGSLDTKPLHSYQITVYKPDFHVPRWYRQGVIYQIFPDRFCKGQDPLARKAARRKKDILLRKWDETPNYLPDPATEKILNNDFFGGNLQGIIDRLDYLSDLGITIIYLNPVFESFSNHRYDTGDYRKIDPMLGDLDTFRDLCNQAANRGIFIILDGVFSHTGSDSVYFNKKGNYPEIGAWQSKDSPYYPWYRFQEYPHVYDCWWGVKTLPNVNETEPSYMDFMIRNKDSVIRYWLQQGAGGWRLDVADELPDTFIRELRKAVKEANPEAVIIGEVWEDASNKISYGSLREYLLGEELDVVMNYPFRNLLLHFLLGNLSGEELQLGSLTMYENYPREAFYGAMNLLGTHDVTRLRTILGEAPIPAETGLSQEKQAEYRMTSEQKDLADKRQRLAAVMQMTLPGVPSVYYGDEAGMEGYSDPHNRRTYPWGQEDQTMIRWYRKLIRLRNQRNVLRNGEYTPVVYEGGLFAFIRSIENNMDVFGDEVENDFLLILVNRDRKPRRIHVDLSRYTIHALRNLIDSDASDAGYYLHPDGDRPNYDLKNGILAMTLDPISCIIFEKVFKSSF